MYNLKSTPIPVKNKPTVSCTSVHLYIFFIILGNYPREQDEEYRRGIVAVRPGSRVLGLPGEQKTFTRAKRTDVSLLESYENRYCRCVAGGRYA